MKSTDDLVSIGPIAKSFGINESTIRRMETAGLLTPAYTTEKSKYRYYDSENIVRIASILTLKHFGFTNDDIWDYFKNQRNIAILYDRLIQKQNSLSLLVNKMRRRIKSSDHFEFEILEYMETYCVIKQARMLPSLTGISELFKQFIFEVIRNEYPIDYTRAVLIITKGTDFRNYQHDREQDLVFCIPLKRNIEKENVIFLASRKVLSVTWNYPMKDYKTLIPLIDQLFSIYEARQCGSLRAAYDYGKYLGSDIDQEDTVIHILIPIEQNGDHDRNEIDQPHTSVDREQSRQT